MRILLADDHALFVEGLRNLLAAHGLEVVATAVDGIEALELCRRQRPDTVLMDIRMPRCDGLTATRLIKAEMPEIRIVILTASAADTDLFDAIRSGACGYLLKTVTGDALIESLAGVEDGVPPLSPGLAARLLEEFGRRSVETPRVRPPDRTPRRAAAAPHGTRPRSGREPRPGLTERQAEVLRLVAAGHTYKEVGSELGLSERTVRYHMAEIMSRLHLAHRSQVLAYAGEARLLHRLD